MKFYKRIGMFGARSKNLVFEAGWYSGDNWMVLQCDFLRFMPEVNYTLIFYLQIGKAAVSVALDWNDPDYRKELPSV